MAAKNTNRYPKLDRAGETYKNLLRQRTAVWRWSGPTRSCMRRYSQAVVTSLDRLEHAVSRPPGQADATALTDARHRLGHRG